MFERRVVNYWKNFKTKIIKGCKYSTLFILVVFHMIYPQCLQAIEDCTYRIVTNPSINYFTIIIDKSGSTEGEALTNSKIGVSGFIDSIKKTDQISIISFNGSVTKNIDFTNNSTKLKQSLEHINADGQTALFDAIAKGISLLRNKPGSKIIVFFTDGKDNKSSYSVSEIEKMNVSENIFVYGIGLGDVSENILNDLTNATNGFLRVTNSAHNIKDLYGDILQRYYQKYGLNNRKGKFTVTSLPDNRNVNLNNTLIGKTPCKIDDVEPGNYRIHVEFAQGTATCKFPVYADKRTLLDFRETDIGRNIIFVSNLDECNVFIDSAFVGSTERFIVKPSDKDLIQKALMDTNQLIVKAVPLGKHEINMKALPDFDFGSKLERTIELVITKEDPTNIVIYVPFFEKLPIKSNTININENTESYDPFKDF